MTGVQIVLVGGPHDGETRMIPADRARSGIAYRLPRPCTPRYVATTEELWASLREPSCLEYRPMMIDFMGWPTRSITDDGTLRYLYAGEF